MAARDTAKAPRRTRVPKRRFEGGKVLAVGAASPADSGAESLRIALADEIDPSAGPQRRGLFRRHRREA